MDQEEKKKLFEVFKKDGFLPPNIWEQMSQENKKEASKIRKEYVLKKRLTNFFKILEKYNIDRHKYVETFDISTQHVKKTLYFAGFNELLITTKKERYSIIHDFFKQKGLKDQYDYQQIYKRTIGELDRELIKRGSKDICDYEYMFTEGMRDIPSPEEMRATIREMLPEGRTAGVTSLEIGKYVTTIRAYYRGSMKQLNKDLGLEPTVNIEDFETIKKTAPTKQEIKIEQISRKIDNLIEKIKPEKFQKLKDELLAVKDLEELELENIDTKLFNKLETSIEDSLKINAGYLYFKKWDLPETTWYKIGKTNNPDRRDSEQNVLPVPAQTLYLLKLGSMEQASSVERAILKTLGDRRIIGAKNKELFKLGLSDYKAVIKALKNLSSKLKEQQKKG